MHNTAESREKRLQALLSEDKNPVAMPTPFGYIRAETLKELIDGYKDKTISSDTLARQVGGTHYKKGVQPWTIALDWGLDPWSHNVVKYILRFPYKGGVEDLKKIKHYLDYLIENYDEVTEKYYNKED
jgi:hypothetical protein